MARKKKPDEVEGNGIHDNGSAVATADPPAEVSPPEQQQGARDAPPAGNP